MGKPKAPEAPDPQKTIAAQTQSNIDTANLNNKLSRSNQQTWTGNSKWVPDENSPSGYTNIQELSPEQQALYLKGNALDQQALGVAGQTLTGVADTLSKPLSFDEAGNAISNVALQDMQRVGAAPTPEMVERMGKLERVANAAPGATVGPAAAMERAGPAGASEKIDMGMLPKFGSVSGAGQGIQGDLDYKSLGMLPTASDETRQRVEQAMYARQQMYLDPQFKREAEMMSQDLDNKGVPLGSEAHKNAMAEFAAAKEQAYSGARNDAITMGGAEQSRLINDQLNIRGEGAREIEAAGGFHNAAQAGRFGQGVTQVGANNNAQAAGLDARLAMLGQRNTANQADFQNQFQVTDQRNQASQREFENNMAVAGFNNQVGSNDLANALSATGQRNDATGNEFQAGSQAIGQNNQARSNQYTQNIQGAQHNNAAAQQEVNNLFANANLSNAVRSQKVQEIIYKYNLPLAAYSTLVSGAQPMLPQFSNTSVNPATVANTDVAGITQSGFNNQMKLYGDGSSKAGAGIGAVAGGIIGSYGGPMGAAVGSQVGSKLGGSISDRRLKRDIVPRGTMSSGLPWYSYTLFGVPEVGVMADEVRVLFPAAVSRGDDGFDRVDYQLLH